MTILVDSQQTVNISKSTDDIENDKKDNALGDITKSIDNEMINKCDNLNIDLVLDMNETCEKSVNTTTCEKIHSIENIKSSSVTEEPKMERIILGVENNTTNTGQEISDTGNNTSDSCLLEPVSNHKSTNDAMDIEKQTNEGKCLPFLFSYTKNKIMIEIVKIFLYQLFMGIK